ncbi:hypothetical protein [Methylocystis parvus]|uniref:Secreted protein n=1 Tax=Methylocystis parvus TaxID=134 RepID=A0A6B8MBA3_9HYPH|nr:hypothetical protein [Methylocystis parvus]QGM97930.1 hypothetical protein F7D14_10910 [Methylocystis parvus]WBK01758.1 hypothetical protein MMG94_08670 [Methylocystis parvus OBBP]
MSPRRQKPRFCKMLALALLIAAPVEATARNIAPPRPAQKAERPHATYMGDCGPNPPPGYRWDLKNWQSRTLRDFSCYMFDEY